MLTIQKSCAQFWVDKLGFTLKQTMPGPDGAKIFVLSPTPEAETAIVLLDKDLQVRAVWSMGKLVEGTNKLF